MNTKEHKITQPDLNKLNNNKHKLTLLERLNRMVELAEAINLIDMLNGRDSNKSGNLLDTLVVLQQEVKEIFEKNIT